MAVTFAQAAELVADPVRRGAIETAAAVSWVWDRMPFENIEGNSYAYDKDKVLPGTAFRTVNEAYVESTGVINQATEQLVILGGDADVDRFIERTMSSARGVLLADQIRMKLESAQATYVDAMFNGDVNVNPKGFDGLKKRLLGDQDAARGAHRLLDEAVDVRVATEDDERLDVLVDDAGGLDVCLVDGAERGAGEHLVLVVGVGVALDVLEGHPVPHPGDLRCGLDGAPANGVGNQCGCLGESDGHGRSHPFLCRRRRGWRRHFFSSFSVTPTTRRSMPGFGSGLLVSPCGP